MVAKTYIENLFKYFSITETTKTLIPFNSDGQYAIEYFRKFIDLGYTFEQIIKVASNTTIMDNDMYNLLSLRYEITNLIKTSFTNEDYSTITKIIIKNTKQKDFFSNQNLLGKYKLILGAIDNRKYSQIKWDEKSLLKDTDVYFGMPRIGLFILDKAMDFLKNNGICALQFPNEYAFKPYAKKFRTKYVNNIIYININNSNETELFFIKTNKWLKNMVINGETFSFKKEIEYLTFVTDKIGSNDWLLVKNNTYYKSDYFPIKRKSKEANKLPYFLEF